MAIWYIGYNRGSLNVRYQNAAGQLKDCGTAAPAQKLSDVADFAITNAAAGDLIRLPSKSVLHVMPQPKGVC